MGTCHAEGVLLAHGLLHGVRTIEESLGVQGKFFNSRTRSFKLTDPECITAVLDLMEAITSIPRKRIRIMDVRSFRDAGHVLQGFHHIGTHSKSVNMSALDPAMGRWVTMLVGHLLAGVKDIFRNGPPNCLVTVMICTGGRHRSVMCTELVHRLASMQGIDCQAVHLCQSTWETHLQHMRALFMELCSQMQLGQAA